MKVYPCTQSEEFPLTWEQVKAEEGVYEAAGYPHLRFVTLHPTIRTNPATLLWNGSEIYRAAAFAWADDRFRRLPNARVCFQVVDNG